MVSACSELVNSIIDEVQKDIRQLRPSNSACDDAWLDKLDDKLSTCREPFAGLSNNYTYRHNISVQ